MSHKITKNILLASLVLLPFSSQAELRPLAADRPDATETPQTVDKGYFEIEVNLAEYSKNKDKGVKTTGYSLLETNLKYGLTDNVDVHLVFSPLIGEKVDGDKTKTTGDVEVRTKVNLWGNDGGESAMALLPYVKIPNGKLSNDEYEGGLIVTYASTVLGYEYGLQVQLDYLYDDSKDKHGFAGSHTAIVGYDINPTFGGYVEYIGEYELNDDYVPYLSLGFTAKASENLEWDLGGKFGLVDKADDLVIFTGFTARF